MTNILTPAELAEIKARRTRAINRTLPPEADNLLTYDIPALLAHAEALRAEIEKMKPLYDFAMNCNCIARTSATTGRAEVLK